jgi:predicted Zn-dependent protease
VVERNASDLIERLRSLCDGPRDGALLRFSLGDALLARGDAAGAADEFRRALKFNPDYSAAWKQLGRALAQANENIAASEAWRVGIDTAARVGDVQAEKEMRVFLRRLDKTK